MTVGIEEALAALRFVEETEVGVVLGGRFVLGWASPIRRRAAL